MNAPKDGLAETRKSLLDLLMGLVTGILQTHIDSDTVDFGLQQNC